MNKRSKNTSIDNASLLNRKQKRNLSTPSSKVPKSTPTFYKALKYKNVIYKVDDDVLFYSNKENYVIGSIRRILNAGFLRNRPSAPSIEVNWYYTKNDLQREQAKLSKQTFSSISELEVFKSNHYDIVTIDSILIKCRILTFEEFDRLEEPLDNVFFTRASYDPVKQRLIPPFDTWPTSCLCQLPINPDQTYIKCDTCVRWYHLEHVNVQENDLLENTEFICSECTN